LENVVGKKGQTCLEKTNYFYNLVVLAEGIWIPNKELGNFCLSKSNTDWPKIKG